jgi:hypothetical protein
MFCPTLAELTTVRRPDIHTGMMVTVRVADFGLTGTVTKAKPFQRAADEENCVPKSRFYLIYIVLFSRLHSLLVTLTTSHRRWVRGKQGGLVFER